MTTEPPAPPPRKKWHIARWLIVLAIALAVYLGWKQYDFRSAMKEAKALEWGVDYTDPLEAIRKDWRAAFKKQTWEDAAPDVTIPTGEQLVQHRKLLLRLNPKELYVQDASLLRDLSALDGLTRLESLSIMDATSLTSVDMLKKHPALEALHLTCGYNLTNVDALQHLPALEILMLHTCTRLTSVDVIQHLPALKQAYLHGCTDLTNLDGLRNRKALARVGLEGCTGLTNADALKSLPALQYIDLEGCTGLPKEAITALKVALPNTQITGP